MKFSALASSSSGNSFFVKSKSESFLIDAGLSCKQTLKKIYSLKESPENLKAIFITHGHIDHTKGADVLSRKFNIPIYTTSGTLKNSFLCSNKNNLIKIKNNQVIKINNTEIQAFSKSHDCKDPISFKITSDNKTLSIITDIGYSCKNVKETIENSNSLIIEANHDEQRLKEGPYPYFLKKRILSKTGHSSNKNSALTILENAKPKIKNIMLAHLSSTNNTPQIAYNTFSKFLKERYDLHPNLILSSPNISTGMYSV